MARLDQELVRQGLAESRSRAHALIEAGVVRVSGQAATKPSKKVAAGVEISVGQDPNPYVSRGGLKLAHALNIFDVDASGKVALDLGASTGGFTDVLLQRGAKRVFAVDVGTGQLHARIAGDERCVSLEQQDVRALEARMVGAPDLIVADLAFISLTKALGAALSLAAEGAQLVALVKPQFELEPAHIGKGGIVRDERYRALARQKVEAWLDAAGWPILGTETSPIAGSDGNREYLVYARQEKRP